MISALGALPVGKPDPAPRGSTPTSSPRATPSLAASLNATAGSALRVSASPVASARQSLVVAAPRARGLEDCGPFNPKWGNEATGQRNATLDPAAKLYWECAARNNAYGHYADLTPAPPASSPITAPTPNGPQDIYGPQPGGPMVPPGLVNAGQPNSNGFSAPPVDLSRFTPANALALQKGAPPVAATFGATVEAPDWAWIAGGLLALGLGGWLLRKKKVI